MSLKNEIELANTKTKLRELEERYEMRQQETPENLHVHELTLRSLKRLINQLKEEIILFEAHQHIGHGT
jgi:hypothetical protein